MTSLLSARLFFGVLLLSLAFCCWAGSVCADDKEDYLTADEVEQLREAQEPHLRLKVLGELLENRLDKARAIKDPTSVKPKPTEPKPDKRKNGKSEKPVAAAPAKKPLEPAEAKSFLAWMEEYLRCLEELSDNVENFSSMPLEPKAYLKSLNKVETTLQEHIQWIDQIESQLDRPEKKVVAEISDLLEELTEDLKAANEKTQEQIKLMKEAEKARSSRRR
jgi:DNA repair exonuclease SbcCD ATPase subunit